MRNRDRYRQCELTQNDHKATAWLLDWQAQLGAEVQLPEVSGIWRVTALTTLVKSGETLRVMKAGEPATPRPRIELAPPSDPFPGMLAADPFPPAPAAEHRSTWRPQ